MADVIDIAAERTKRLPPDAATPVTAAAWLYYEDKALAFTHVFADYMTYFDRAETTDEERRNLANNLHIANDELFEAAKAYDESFGMQANGDGTPA
ncbi:MAG: hypothetical protein ACLPKT_06035 [Methylocella sp.]